MHDFSVRDHSPKPALVSRLVSRFAQRRVVPGHHPAVAHVALCAVGADSERSLGFERNRHRFVGAAQSRQTRFGRRQIGATGKAGNPLSFDANGTPAPDIILSTVDTNSTRVIAPASSTTSPPFASRVNENFPAQNVTQSRFALKNMEFIGRSREAEQLRFL